MRLAALATILSTTVLVTGCQNLTQAQMQNQQIQQRLVTGVTNYDNCLTKIKNANPQITETVASQVLFVSTAAPNKIDLMSLERKPTKTQIDTLKAYAGKKVQCQQTLLDGVSGTPYYNNSLEFLGNENELYLEFFKGNMTIGALNTRYDQVLREISMKQSSTTQQIQANLSAAHNQEVANRQSMGLAALQLYTTQQAIAQQNYYNQLNQIRPYNTQCTVIGNIADCVTR